MPKGVVLSRQRHTKSRLGCSACKQRHQKCDETRPSCVNCVTAHRRCPYLETESSSGPSSPSRETTGSISAGTAGDHHENDTIVPIQLVLHSVTNDLVYVELLQHWLSHTYQACVGPKAAADNFGPIVFNRALNSPYLMRSMLALAALHKASSATGAEEQRYLTLSDELQAEGLSRFNALMSDLTAETIIPSFLFAFITGIHRLCYALGRVRTRNSILDDLVEAMTLLKGVETIISGWWPFIKESELKVLLSGSNEPNTSMGETIDTEPITYLKKTIEACGIDKSICDVYSLALDGLSSAYGNLNQLSNSPQDHSVGFVVVWMITISSEFIRLVRERQPQALAVLAHAAPLFHYRRHCWGIDDAGKHLLEAIRAEMPDAWPAWLAWPSQIIATT